MKTTKYKGVFIGDDGSSHQCKVNCNGFLQAFFLLTAKAIQSGKHYQLNTIINENGATRNVDSILKCNALLT